MKNNEKIKYKMTNEEAISYLKWARPIKPYSLDKKKVQMAIDMAIEALEQESRDCKTCKHSNNGNCAYTEECHECMWENKYEQVIASVVTPIVVSTPTIIEKESEEE